MATHCDFSVSVAAEGDRKIFTQAREMIVTTLSNPVSDETKVLGDCSCSPSDHSGLYGVEDQGVKEIVHTSQRSVQFKECRHEKLALRILIYFSGGNS